MADGETLFRLDADDAAPPGFRADMLPNEVAELVESSIVNVLGEGQVADGPDYDGLAGGFVADGRLYLLIFLGAEPYYAGKHRAAAEAIIGSARL